MKLNLIKLEAAAFVIISIAAAENLSSQQQYSTQTFHSGAGFAVGPDIDRLDMLTHMLSLNANQKDQAKAILDEEEALSKPLAEQLKQATEALATAQKAGAPDAEIDQLARNMASISGEILAVDAKAQSRIYSQLTAEQKQRLEEMPRPFFAPYAPLFPPGPMFITASGRPKN